MSSTKKQLPDGLTKLNLSPNAEAVYRVLYTSMPYGEPVQIAKSLIAKKITCSVHHVTQALDELFQTGLLKDVSFPKKAKQVLLCIPTKDGKRDSVSGLPIQSNISGITKEQIYKDSTKMMGGFSNKQKEQTTTWLIDMLVSVIYLTRFSQEEDATDYAKLLKRKNKWGEAVGKDVLLKIKLQSLAVDDLLPLFIDELVWNTRSMIDVHYMSTMLLETLAEIANKTFKQ